MRKFTEGQELSTRSLCNYDYVFTGKVISRTDKTVTISTDETRIKRCKIHFDSDGNEFIYPFGRHSMCPTFWA